MAIEKEIWGRYIQTKTFKDNPHLRLAFSEDEHVLAGAVVHIPQAGAAPAVVKNRNSFPAVAVRRTDTDVTYALDEYSTDPVHIQHAEKYEVSYDKMDSVLGDHIGQVSEVVGDDMLIKWATDLGAGSIVRTTGGLTADLVTGQTGSRRVFTHKDLQKAAKMMNLQNVSKNGRYAVLESNMMDQLKDSLSDSQYRDFSEYYDAKNGVIGRLHGIDILDRSTVVMLTAADGVTPLGTAVAATYNVGSLVFQKDCVTRALGTVKMFEDKDNPLYYGDIYSTLLRMGGRRRRADDKGVVAIVQAAA